MQALIEMIIGFIALLAAAALAQFGVESRPEQRNAPEVQRVVDCETPAPPKSLVSATPRHDC